MPRYSQRSLDRLATCDDRIQKVFHEVIKTFDVTVLQGHRSIEEQQALYAQGRTKPGKIVTHIDGISRKGNHNYQPSRAIDVAPWPIDWNDIGRFREMAAAVKAAAACVGVELDWGGDWRRFKDYPHFELSNP